VSGILARRLRLQHDKHGRVARTSPLLRSAQLCCARAPDLPLIRTTSPPGLGDGSPAPPGSGHTRTTSTCHQGVRQGSLSSPAAGHHSLAGAEFALSMTIGPSHEGCAAMLTTDARHHSVDLAEVAEPGSEWPLHTRVLQPVAHRRAIDLIMCS